MGKPNKAKHVTQSHILARCGEFKLGTKHVLTPLCPRVQLMIQPEPTLLHDAATSVHDIRRVCIHLCLIGRCHTFDVLC